MYMIATFSRLFKVDFEPLGSRNIHVALMMIARLSEPVASAVWKLPGRNNIKSTQFLEQVGTRSIPAICSCSTPAATYIYEAAGKPGKVKKVVQSAH